MFECVINIREKYSEEVGMLQTFLLLMKKNK